MKQWERSVSKVNEYQLAEYESVSKVSTTDLWFINHSWHDSIFDDVGNRNTR